MPLNKEMLLLWPSSLWFLGLRKRHNPFHPWKNHTEPSTIEKTSGLQPTSQKTNIRNPQINWWVGWRCRFFASCCDSKKKHSKFQLQFFQDVFSNPFLRFASPFVAVFSNELFGLFHWRQCHLPQAVVRRHVAANIRRAATESYWVVCNLPPVP